MSRLVLFMSLATALLAATPASGDVSFRSLTKKDDAARFYARGGRGFEGRRIHIHVPANNVLAKGTSVRRPKGGRVVRFENRSVPLVVNPKNVYFRKILQRAKAGQNVCIKGTVRRDPAGGGGRLALWIHTIKRAP